MNPCNAVIKKWGIRESEGYSRCVELWLELETQNGYVCYTVYGVYTPNWEKNQMGYGIKRVMEIAGVDDLKNLTGRPIRAKFKEDGQLGDIIIGIGHFMKEDWLILRENKLWNDNAIEFGKKQSVFQILQTDTVFDEDGAHAGESETILPGVWSSYAVAQLNVPIALETPILSRKYTIIQSELDPNPENN